jgi:hypothetical protein
MDNAGDALIASEGGGRRFNASAQPTGAMPPGAMAVDMDADGDFVVVWGSGGQRYDAAGQPVGSTLPVGGSAVAMDADGNFVVAWSAANGTGADIYARRYSAAGELLGEEFRVSSPNGMNQRRPTLATDALGNFVVAWDTYAKDGDGYGIYARRYGTAGEPLGPEFRVNRTVAGHQQFASAAMDMDGDFVVAWTCNTPPAVYAQGFNAAGGPQGPEFRVNTTAATGAS